MPIVVSSYWSASRPVSTAALKARVTQVYGLEDDDDANGVALGHLDETVDDLNTYLWQFARVTEVGLTFTTDQNYIDLTAPIYKESQAYTVKTSIISNEMMTCYPWAAFQRQFISELGTHGLPRIYSFKALETDGRIYLHPKPSADAVADYTLTIDYYQRLPRASDNVTLDIPRELETALLYGAQMRFAIHIMGAGHADVGAYAALYRDAIGRLRTIDQTHPDELTRFRTIDAYVRGVRVLQPGTMYIRV